MNPMRRSKPPTKANPTRQEWTSMKVYDTCVVYARRLVIGKFSTADDGADWSYAIHATSFGMYKSMDNKYNLKPDLRRVNRSRQMVLNPKTGMMEPPHNIVDEIQLTPEQQAIMVAAVARAEAEANAELEARKAEAKALGKDVEGSSVEDEDDEGYSGGSDEDEDDEDSGGEGGGDEDASATAESSADVESFNEVDPEEFRKGRTHNVLKELREPAPAPAAPFRMSRGARNALARATGVPAAAVPPTSEERFLQANPTMAPVELTAEYLENQARAIKYLKAHGVAVNPHTLKIQMAHQLEQQPKKSRAKSMFGTIQTAELSGEEDEEFVPPPPKKKSKSTLGLSEEESE